MSHIDINDVVAHIKPEYVVEVESQAQKQEGAPDETGDDATSEPPTKKQKLGGTNKKRPKLVKTPRHEKLCRGVWCLEAGEEPKDRCLYPVCAFSHDISAYLATKPPNLHSPCHNYTTFGLCHYGVVCRFGGEHIQGERNKVNKELWDIHKDSPTVTNTLNKELQVSLRKRTYDFSKAKEYHRLAQSERDFICNQMEADKNDNIDGTTNGTHAENGGESTKSEMEVSDGHIKKTDILKESLESDNIETIIPKDNTNSNQIETDIHKENKTSEGETIVSELNTKADESERTDVNESSTSKSDVNESSTSKNDNSGSVGSKESRAGDTEDLEKGKAVTEETTQRSGEKKRLGPAPEETTQRSGEKKRIGPAPEEDIVKLLSREKKKMTWTDKTYLAPLTTLGNLPFRRVCKRYGADITCGEMAMANCLLQGAPSEWALVKRHKDEDCFGVQVCGNNAETMIRCAQLLEENIDFDFLDINMGCPIDLVYKQGGGSALLRRVGCLEQMVRGMTKAVSRPLTLKMRTAIYRNTRVAHTIITKAKLWDVSMVTVHGRSREQRYLKLADWGYIDECARVAHPMPVFGNGDVLSFEDYNSFREHSNVAGVMIGRGALVKPWVFTEIKEQRHWDISASERLDMLKLYVNYGLEHWGSDSEGIEKTRRFLLEWLSFLNRYIPRGLLESTQRLNQRPPLYTGRGDLETLMASRSSKDWVKISEMLLGPTPPDFMFLPKHKANAY